jgi:hypothetical protein
MAMAARLLERMVLHGTGCGNLSGLSDTQRGLA